jgi:hypothetical protein
MTDLGNEGPDDGIPTDSGAATDAGAATGAGIPTDPNALVQYVLREAYLQATEDLRDFAAKVQKFNRQKKTIRDYLRALRQFEAGLRASMHEAGVDPCSAEASDPEIVAKIMESGARAYPVDELAFELCIPDRVPASGITTTTALVAEILKWEEKLNSIGDDSQLANVDLQNMLQKQQQTLQMMSNISKMLHDTATSVIRKIGG